MNNHTTILTADLATTIAKDYKDDSISGRWITLRDIEKVFSKFNNSAIVSIEKIGISEENRSIHQIKIGKGARKILIWTQMHGNESTGTKAILDLLNYFHLSKDKIIIQILSECTIKIIPILNPDGAEYYTRENALNVDLNRDAVDVKAKESKLLRSVLLDFIPDFCFNLHDQRSVFGVEGTRHPATISFLAPSEEETRKVTQERKKAMNVIVSMNTLLQLIIPNHIGRYTDTFYPTATGDNFQKLGFPTILIESGHYPDDYEREVSRKYTFLEFIQNLYSLIIQYISIKNLYVFIKA